MTTAQKHEALRRSHARLLASLRTIVDAADARCEEYGDRDHPDVVAARQAVRQGDRVVGWLGEDVAEGREEHAATLGRHGLANPEVGDGGGEA